MKYRVDPTKCQGHALCAAVDEALFPLDEEGYSAVGNDLVDVPDGAEDRVRLGAGSCPERAILIEN